MLYDKYEPGCTPLLRSSLITWLAMARPRRTFLISVVAAIVAASPAWAQSGSLSGKVTGAGGPLAGAVVSLDASGLRVAEVRTRSDGSYRITGVPTGSYTVRVRSFGYTPPRLPEHGHLRGGTVTVDAELTAGADAARGGLGQQRLENRGKADRGTRGGLRPASTSDRGASGAHRRRSPQDYSGRRRHPGRPGVSRALSPVASTTFFPARCSI